MNPAIYTQTDADLQNNANLVKDLLLARLEQDGVVGNAAKLSETYCVLLVRKGLFGRILDKFFGAGDDSVFFKIVKIS